MKSDELRVQRASIGDAENLARVYRSAYQENRRLGFPAKAESITKSEVEGWIQKNRVYIVKIEDEVIGGVRLEVTDSARVKLSRLGVYESWKGEGVGSRLLDHAEDVIRDSDYSTVWLTTPEDHSYLPELYRRRGYEMTGVSSYYPPCCAETNSLMIGQERQRRYGMTIATDSYDRPPLQ
jgi:ribosomal protein S18 acetylase RimI-like enzyme